MVTIWFKVWPDSTQEQSVTAVYSPVELIVVVMCLPPEVEPDKQQTEGKEKDEGPQQLPLHIRKHTNEYN